MPKHMLLEEMMNQFKHTFFAVTSQAIIEGAALRVRPIAMTVAVIIAGLLPIMWGSGTGSEVMRRIASPMVGGMIAAPLLSMIVVPVVYMLVRRRQFPGHSTHALREQT